jgi:hypothetical protein
MSVIGSHDQPAEATAVLLQMAAEGEIDIRKLEEAGRTASDRT